MSSSDDSHRSPEYNVWTASDGYPLHYRRWRPDGPPRGYVVAVHGIQSHSGWYDFSSSRLAEAGYDVTFPDRRGSGQNGRDRGHVVHWERWLNDLSQFLGFVSFERDRTTSDAPVVLMGISWGGKLATAAAACRPDLVDALALLYPGLFAQVKPTFLQSCLLRLARKLGANRKSVPVPLDDPEMFTNETGWQQFIRDDPLALHHVTTGFLFANADVQQVAIREAPQIACPILLMLAGRDRIVDNDATQQFFDALPNPSKTRVDFPNARHTLEFEPDREDFVRRLIDWLDELEQTPRTN
ncbi:Phospholipase YtpA [Maioricimonas rarisocia]|uniref:Phospholipase YtpA n=1 Tax=Maioricimonas rarisocia TaxID=2528026 RepID=A0A517Z2Z9_9PLAN|nr:alpha/beta fold hydrolase [Maioricimonas rarisocia]QDU36880.1 Phospholipase YtpA [Maioricimonas rarisocia]